VSNNVSVVDNHVIIQNNIITTQSLNHPIRREMDVQDSLYNSNPVRREMGVQDSLYRTNPLNTSIPQRVIDTDDQEEEEKE
jgi:hypothetical protein